MAQEWPKGTETVSWGEREPQEPLSLVSGAEKTQPGAYQFVVDISDADVPVESSNVSFVSLLEAEYVDEIYALYTGVILR